MIDSVSHVPKWMRTVLITAGYYNILIGSSLVLFPTLYFELLGLTIPIYPSLWQCIGMIVGVFGIGYLIAAGNPTRHWPIVLVGLLGKILGPIGFLFAWGAGELALRFGAIIITNDLIWWVPFFLILFQAANLHQRRLSNGEEFADVATALANTITVSGQTLVNMSGNRPVLLVFLRHLGCIFCLETVRRLALQRVDIEQQGVAVVLVTMSPEERAREFLSQQAVNDIDIVSDPNQRLYRAFDFGRGRLGQLFGPTVWWRGFQALWRIRGRIGKLEGDGFQMPGVALVADGEVIARYEYRTAADRVDLSEFTRCSIGGSQPADSAARRSEGRVGA